MTHAPAISVSGLTHHYGSRCAIDAIEFDIPQGEIFAFVGPNGGGKTTLFRVLSTLIPVQQGSVSILGQDLRNSTAAVRHLIGVVFQAASLDKKLTVDENLRHQGHLYGLTSKLLNSRRDEMLDRFGLTDRRGDLAEKLSGGLRRRVELAKGMMHHPRLLLLDEPSTGLDPAARNDLWAYLERMRSDEGVSVVLTTHLLEEAERADRIGILDQGRLVAFDSPDALRATVGGDAITIRTAESQRLSQEIQQQFGFAATVVEQSVRLEQPNGHELIARIVEAFPGQVDSITFARPTLEDVFIDRTGHRFRREVDSQSQVKD